MLCNSELHNCDEGFPRTPGPSPRCRSGSKRRPPRIGDSGAGALREPRLLPGRAQELVVHLGHPSRDIDGVSGGHRDTKSLCRSNPCRGEAADREAALVDFDGITMSAFGGR